MSIREFAAPQSTSLPIPPLVKNFEEPQRVKTILVQLNSCDSSSGLLTGCLSVDSLSPAATESLIEEHCFIFDDCGHTLLESHAAICSRTISLEEARSIMDAQSGYQPSEIAIDAIDEMKDLDDLMALNVAL